MRWPCYCARMGGLILLLIVWAVVGGGIGYWIGSRKGRSGLGFALGFLLGWIGWIAIALIPATAEVEARRTAALANALRSGASGGSGNGEASPDSQRSVFRAPLPAVAPGVLFCSGCGFWPRPGEASCDNCGLALPEATIEANKDRYPV